MSNSTLSVGDDSPILSSILADPRQRRILALLLEQPHPLTDRDLAVQLAAREAEKPPSDVAEEDLQQILVELYHWYLPELQKTGWIDRHPEGIVTTEQFPFGDADSSLPPLQDPEVPWEALATLLARPRRGHIVSILARQDQSLSLEKLAARLAAYERISGTAERGDSALSGTLHHVDLPRLDEVGLIEYDPEENTITRERDLTQIVDWIDDMGEGFNSESET